MNTSLNCLHTCERSVDHVMIAGDVGQSALIQAQIAMLPFCAYGQVFIEAADAAEVFTIDAPQRVTVTWLIATPDAPHYRSGDLLCRALNGWAAEFLSAPEFVGDHCFSLWVGASSNPDLAEVAYSLTEQLDRVRAEHSEY